MQLNELRKGESARILRVHGTGAFRKRILEMGFVQGQEVTMRGRAPLGDPYLLTVMGYCVTLREDELRLIDVEPLAAKSESSARTLEDDEGAAGSAEDVFKESASQEGKALQKPSRVIRVALVGNPNSGKTSLFNFAAGAKEHTGNYSGVTIESKTAHFTHGEYTVAITDLPGTYSLTAYSPEERYVREFITKESPDVVINVVDTTNLDRSLYLTLQLREMGARVAIALNMYDEFQSQGGRINRLVLGEMLGVVSTPTVGRTGLGIRNLLDSVVGLYERGTGGSVDVVSEYGETVVSSVATVQKALSSLAEVERWSVQETRHVALKLIEKDQEITQRIQTASLDATSRAAIGDAIQALEKQTGEDSETYVTDARYAFIARVVQRAYTRRLRKEQKSLQNKIDGVLTNRWLGLPIFFGLIFLIFWLTFTVGEYPLQWIESLVGWIGGLVETYFPAGPLRDLIEGAVIGGVGNVIVFLPHIMILFFCIAMLEDTGYMARAVFLIDRVMRGVGLHGHSFIPLVMGFGCNVPAIMATRAIADRKVRLTTMLVDPFMSCSARLPVYVLLIYSLFPSHHGALLFGIYLLGIAVAMLTAWIFRKTLLRGDDTPFVMEMPPYRVPTLRSTLLHMWRKASQYLRKMGSVILLASVIIWFFSYFPATTPRDEEFEQRTEQLENRLALYAGGNGSTDGDTLTMQEQRDSLKRELAVVANERMALQQRNSMLGRVGRAIEPVIEPLGFDWRIGVSLLSGFAAKEVVVSTLGALLQTGSDVDEESVLLRDRIRTVRVEAGPRAGDLLFTPLVALTMLVFVLLYVPCIAAVAAIKKESGGWRWAAFAVCYSTSLAYLLSLLVYQVGSLF